jgi:uncharacterized protein YkwD
MKKFIVTSACTLVLSLIGAFGFNQNLLSFGEEINTNSVTTRVVENVTDTDSNQSLSSDDQTTAVTNTAAGTETASSVSKAEVKGVSTTKASTKTTAVKKAKAKKAKAKKAKAKKTTAKKTAANNNSQVLSYNNVNLSNCDSVNEVVSVLQKNGFTNINKSNINNISGLKDILAKVQANGSANNSTTPTPTKAPVQTTKPTPTTQPAPTTKPSTSTSTTGTSKYASEVLRLVNIERSKAGLSAFTTNQPITNAANKRAQEIVKSFSHTRPNGSSPFTALQEYGVSYRTAGENIAYGQKTPQEVVTGWMNSPGHRANILNANFNKIGIGVYQTNGVYYWTQLFTN